MKYHGLKLQPMQESGAFLLRAMQNESMIRLDLLVRESIQNVIDAALGKKGDEVRVDYVVRTHATETIASLLVDGIDGPKLRKRFSNGGRLLEIRDSLTEGLTGPLALDDVSEGQSHGNLLKLVYEIGRTRSDEGAGGSWGLGKTCYFRMGIGLVFYYSRIRLGNNYEERLVACLVENEASPDRLQLETRTGIAWWGADESRPITRVTQIRSILEKMGVRRFADDETGTAVIIPFLRDDLIPVTLDSPSDTNPKEEVHYPAWWYRSYETYLEVAVQRWFCARLDNPYFATGARLTASVNGKIIRKEKMLPVFQVIQSLYNRTVMGTVAVDDYFTKNGVEPKSLLCEPILIKSVFQKPGAAGKVCGVLLSPTQLKMAPPDNNPDPYLCIFGDSQPMPPFRPIVTFMRKPGMSIRWDDSIEARAWAGGLHGPADGRFLIAIFVPEQDRPLTNALASTLGLQNATLESYLRSCERADHSQWKDLAGQSIITRIRSHTGKRLRDFGSMPSRITTAAPAIRMARNLADLLLPQRGLGSDGRSGSSSPSAVGRRTGAASPGGSRPSMNPFLRIEKVLYQTGCIQIRWTLIWGGGTCHAPRSITVAVDSENGPIGINEWSESGLGRFPFAVSAVVITADPQFGDSSISPTVVSDETVIVLRAIPSSAKPAEIHGIITLSFRDDVVRSLRPRLSVSAMSQEADSDE